MDLARFVHFAIKTNHIKEYTVSTHGISLLNMINLNVESADLSGSQLDMVIIIILTTLSIEWLPLGGHHLVNGY